MKDEKNLRSILTKAAQLTNVPNSSIYQSIMQNENKRKNKSSDKMFLFSTSLSSLFPFLPFFPSSLSSLPLFLSSSLLNLLLRKV